MVGGGWFGVASFVAVLCLVAVLGHELAFGIDWFALGRMDTARFIAGEGWRALTALTLHADTIHLLGNVAFGALFTYFVGRYLGGGVGWIAILASGALGNALNGWLTGPDHRSIGASTAVFGALGLLSAFTWRRGFPRGTTRRSRLAPVVAGIALLAFTGTAGQNTDLGAHLLGFAVGFLIGLGAARLPWPGATRVQLTAGSAAWLLVAGAWAWGIIATR
jgi:membrane associated rhomboid family serine protease